MPIEREEIKKIVVDLIASADGPRFKRIHKINAGNWKEIKDLTSAKEDYSILESLTDVFYTIFSENYPYYTIEKIRVAADKFISKGLGRTPMFTELLDLVPGHLENVADGKRARKAEFESMHYTKKELQFMKELKKAYIIECHKEGMTNRTIQ